MAWRVWTCMAQVSPTGICSEELKVQSVADLANDLQNAEYCLKSFHWMEAKLQNRHPTPPIFLRLLRLPNILLPVITCKMKY